jgi:hypothetical protein
MKIISFKKLLIIFLDIIASLLASLAAAISIIFFNIILHLIGNIIHLFLLIRNCACVCVFFFLLEYVGQDRVHASRSSNPNATVPRRAQNNNGLNYDKVERATSPVDQRIINEFYSDQPKDMHQYQLNGRQYVVYEGNNFGDLVPYRKGK